MLLLASFLILLGIYLNVGYGFNFYFFIFQNLIIFFLSYIFSTLLFVIFALACHLSLTTAEENKRIALRRPVGKSAKASTTTTPAPAEDEEGDYAENGEDNQYPDESEDAASSTTTTTTTETPKRIGPVIRPFRSNDDFLNSLKRRQMNAKKNKCKLNYTLIL